MSFDFIWDDESKTRIRYVAEGDWNWNDLHKHMRRSLLALDRIDHPVETIIDLRRGSRLPAGALAHLRSLGKQDHPNRQPRAVILGVDEAVQTQMGCTNGVYQTQGQALYFVTDDNAANQLIAGWQPAP